MLAVKKLQSCNTPWIKAFLILQHPVIGSNQYRDIRLLTESTVLKRRSFADEFGKEQNPISSDTVWTLVIIKFTPVSHLSLFAFHIIIFCHKHIRLNLVVVNFSEKTENYIFYHFSELAWCQPKWVEDVDPFILQSQCHSWRSLWWRHNGRDSVSNHQPHDCLLKLLFRRTSKKTSKLCVTGLCTWNAPGTGEFPAQMASNVENVSTCWRHHVYIYTHTYIYIYIHLYNAVSKRPEFDYTHMRGHRILDMNHNLHVLDERMLRLQYHPL